ncbi:chemotaxis protein CheX [Aliikangiella coralliicola]|uniref:Chemotaxis protein CheX n=1 Tax=Aliikangiella coralliicola TaxID=2592383 RepID=A0A545U6C7_9GAMM|nr:chemotaxis protein CheX [Aliikangiella coralliicola]TQV85028.1 chemotaxis protein CheX [Aliikangiella coralliicola]
MNVEFINPFLSSMTNVLATMASLVPQANGPQIKHSELPPGDITGIIPMSSPQADGTLALSFSEPVILHIASNMLGDTFSEIDDEIADLVGELTNMVTGGAKKLLESKGYDFDMATPTVIRGKGQKITHASSSGAVIIVPFNTEAGDFYVEVCFKNKR